MRRRVRVDLVGCLRRDQLSGARRPGSEGSAAEPGRLRVRRVVAQPAARLPRLRARPVLTRLVHEHDQQRRVGARRNHRPFNTAGITLADYANSFQRMDNFVDTADFDLTYMMNLWYGYRDVLPADVRTAMEGHMRSFKYWFTDPQPTGTIDQRYYWSENHRLLFHADEYLAGQAFPSDVFSSDGNTGAWHKERARGFIDAWLTEKARFGFTEWHSDVYYQKTADALLTIVEWVDDPASSQRASMVLDLALLRHRAQHPARQLRRDARPLVHEGQERRHRSGHVQPVEAPVRRHAPPVHIGRRSRRHVAGPRPALPPPRRDPARRGVEAHHGRPGAHGRPARPVGARRREPRPASLGYSFSDPKNVEFWWERGAQTAWQTVPLTLDTLGPVRPVGVGLLHAVQAASPTSPAATATWRRRSPSSSIRCWASRCSRQSTPTPTAATR